MSNFVKINKDEISLDNRKTLSSIANTETYSITGSTSINTKFGRKSVLELVGKDKVKFSVILNSACEDAHEKYQKKEIKTFTPTFVKLKDKSGEYVSYKEKFNNNNQDATPLAEIKDKDLHLVSYKEVATKYGQKYLLTVTEAKNNNKHTIFVSCDSFKDLVSSFDTMSKVDKLSATFVIKYEESKYNPDIHYYTWYPVETNDIIEINDEELEDVLNDGNIPF